MALAGLIYTVYPKAASSRLARIHFWLHSTALPAMMALAPFCWAIRAPYRSSSRRRSPARPA